MTTTGFSLEEPTPLPTLPELRKLLRKHGKVAIKHSAADKAYVDVLFEGLENHYVYRWGNGTLVVEPSVGSEEIIEREEQIYAAARQFRHDATRLMQLMATMFGFKLDTLEGLWSLKRMHKNAGALNEEWLYRLHGHECHFRNTRTGQVLEVIIITLPEFGFLDAFFFYLYLSTTDEFSALAEWFGDYHRVAKAIDVLARRGRLAPVHALCVDRYVALD